MSDGYGNPRIVKYTRDGKYLLQWGTRGSGPGEFQQVLGSTHINLMTQAMLSLIIIVLLAARAVNILGS